MDILEGRKQYKYGFTADFNERDWMPTTRVPQPFEGGPSGWGKHVDLESKLRTGLIRGRGTYDNPRGIIVPLSLQMNYLPHGWQQSDFHTGHYAEETRSRTSDIQRPVTHGSRDDLFIIPNRASQASWYANTPSQWDPEYVHKVRGSLV